MNFVEPTSLQRSPSLIEGLTVSQLTSRSHLHSAQKMEFDKAHSHTTFGLRSFSVTAPQAWNHLPAGIRQLSTSPPSRDISRPICL